MKRIQKNSNRNRDCSLISFAQKPEARGNSGDHPARQSASSFPYFCRLHKYYFWMVVYFLSTHGLRIKWMAGNSLHQSSFILLTMPSMSTFIQLQSPCPTPTYKAEPNCRITGYFWDPRLVTSFNTTKLTSEGVLRNQTNSPGWAQSE